MTGRPWLWPVIGVALAPLVTWLPMLMVRWPWLPLPHYQNPAQGIDLWQMQTLWLVCLGMVASILWRSDRWLSAAVGLAALTIFWRGAAMEPTHSLIFALAALGLWAVRQTPALHVPGVLRVLAGAGAFQAAYVLQQKWLSYDLLWGPLFGGVPTPTIQPLGTLGTVDAASAFIAVAATLMPWWLLPLPIAAVFVSQSMGANAALVLGLAVRYGPGIYRHARWSPGPAAAALAVAVWYFLTYVKTLDAVWPRVAMWRFGLHTAVLSEPVMGWGLGGWAQRMPWYQQQARFSPTGEIFREAHSEWVQWACEAGVIGLVILAGWLWSHRHMVAHPHLGGAVSALAVTCGSFFTLHTVATGLLGLVVIGLATAPKAPAFQEA